MREIKLRAFDREYDEKVYPVKSIDWDSNEVCLDDPKDGLPFFIRRELDEVELIQFIGCHDKHGDEIYDGHIVKHHSNSFGDFIGVVEYCSSPYESGFDIKWQGKSCSVRFDQMEIIGTKWENPELLGGDE